MQVRKMRILRLKYDISLAELASSCGVSSQRISEIELKADVSVTRGTAEMVKKGFARLIAARQSMIHQLHQDFECHKDALMDCVEEIGYEL